LESNKTSLRGSQGEPDTYSKNAESKAKGVERVRERSVVDGDFWCPSVGRSGDRPWGTLLAAYRGVSRGRRNRINPVRSPLCVRLQILPYL
jgi:hypothetical protein